MSFLRSNSICLHDLHDLLVCFALLLLFSHRPSPGFVQPKYDSPNTEPINIALIESLAGDEPARVTPNMLPDANGIVPQTTGTLAVDWKALAPVQTTTKHSVR